MAEDLMIRQGPIDPEILADVLRKDLRSPSFAVSGWSVRAFNNKGLGNSEGVWLLRGDGFDHNGPRFGSVVVKVLRRQEEDLRLHHFFHWQRELYWAKSGLAEYLTGAVRAPKVYRAEEAPGGARLWMEYVEDQRASPWGLDDYAFAARQLGRWNGASALAGRSLPDKPWFARHHYRSWANMCDTARQWQSPIHERHISPNLRRRYERFLADCNTFYTALDALPGVFSHFDSHRRNLLIGKGRDGSDELVLVDWAMCGIGPLGAELYALVGVSAILLEWDPTAVRELDATAFGNYVRGLEEAGFLGDWDAVRLGYVAWLAVWLGVAFPQIAAYRCADRNCVMAMNQFGACGDELYVKYLSLLDYSLDCADEARELINKRRVKE